MRRRAFTLLELVIALAAVAIVAAYALPGWYAQIARGHRIDAVAALYRAAQWIDTQNPSALALPAGYEQAPSTGRPVYRLRIASGDETNGGYAISAEPAAGGPMRDDTCGTFVLDATGVRGNRVASGDAAATVTQMCWKDR
ncbi:type IV pilin protein [Paraburkholderia acidisoli]|uniref:Prepilin-type N-terminal cleavage/methylation domain-containing protein n=1 Tax=Paraburkholderia acidisoli TaxID=2571748 RepID=A0A7Z2JEC5_9BURK|nr:type IV pilin protein [Paraburkholderia acidisoli]QGZ62197.1 prepilin-type N-terminal cleavage/methylation domain-containing protein [Paraburkholderia acidisoli]